MNGDGEAGIDGREVVEGEFGWPANRVDAEVRPIIFEGGEQPPPQKEKEDEAIEDEKNDDDDRKGADFLFVLSAFSQSKILHILILRRAPFFQGVLGEKGQGDGNDREQ